MVPGTLDVAEQHRDILASAFTDLQERWSAEVPQQLADEYLSRDFASPHAEINDSSNIDFVVVNNIGLPTSWNEQQTAAWFRFEEAIQHSIKQAYAVYAHTVREMLESSEIPKMKLKGRFTLTPSSISKYHGQSSAENLEIAYEDQPCGCVVPAYARRDCPDCGGTGRVKVSGKYWDEESWCACVEYTPKAYCDICGGTGVVQASANRKDLFEID